MTEGPVVERQASSRMQHSWRWVLVSVVLLAAILVPFALFEERMNGLASWLLSPERPRVLVAAATVVLLAADIVLPVPSSLVSTGAGAMFGFAGGTALSWLGMTAGSLIALVMGRILGRPGLERFVGARDLEQAGRLAARHGDMALILSRPVPVLAEASVLLAAACGVRPIRLLVLCALSNAGISIVYAAAGALAVSAASFLLVFLGSVALPAIAISIHRKVSS